MSDKILKLLSWINLTIGVLLVWSASPTILQLTNKLFFSSPETFKTYIRSDLTSVNIYAAYAFLVIGIIFILGFALQYKKKWAKQLSCLGYEIILAILVGHLLNALLGLKFTFLVVLQLVLLALLVVLVYKLHKEKEGWEEVNYKKAYVAIISLLCFFPLAAMIYAAVRVSSVSALADVSHYIANSLEANKDNELFGMTFKYTNKIADNRYENVEIKNKENLIRSKTCMINITDENVQIELKNGSIEHTKFKIEFENHSMVIPFDEK